MNTYKVTVVFYDLDEPVPPMTKHFSANSEAEALNLAEKSIKEVCAPEIPPMFTLVAEKVN